MKHMKYKKGEEIINMNTKLAIILVNYKNPDITIDCINSIRKSSYKNYEIIVVDNASKDNSLEKLNKITDIILLKSETNKGFSAGNNIGIRYAIKAGFDYVLLLNNDTIIDKDLLKILMKYASPDKVLIPKILYFDKPDYIWYDGGKIDYLRGCAKHINMGKKIDEANNNITSVDFATACCLLLSVTIIKRIGFLPEEYFMYSEDFDYSLNLKRNNIPIKYIPEAKLWHKEGTTSGGKHSLLTIYYSSRNRLYILDKYNFSVEAKLITRVTLLIKFLYGLVFNNNYRIIKKAYIDYLGLAK
jgi:hypothetical protein